MVLTLVVGGKRLALSHLGPSGIVVRDACEPIPPSHGKLLIQVDDTKKARRVFLPDGVPGPGQLIGFKNVVPA